MYTKLSIPERLKDLRVVDKHLTLEQLADRPLRSRSHDRFDLKGCCHKRFHTAEAAIFT